MRLDVYLAEELGSRAAAQRAITEGRVTVDGVVRPKRFLVPEGARVEVNHVQKVPETGTELPRFDVVFEDEDVLAVDKPAGVVVHPASAVSSGTLVQALAGRVAGGEDPARPGVVHRLDRDTSGLIIFTCNQSAWESLSAQIKAREVEREYVALVGGRPAAKAGTIDAPLGRDRRRRTRMSSDTDNPREAVTHFSIEEPFDGASLLRVVLETGRTHQIRAHLEAIGNPILGDKEYGTAHPGLERQFLHARRLAFVHPSQGTRVELRSELPDDLAATLETFRNPTLR